jgi:hypothetical protein
MLMLPRPDKRFADVLRDDYVHVDKTQYPYPLLKKGGCHYPVRPRRFGKTFLIRALFDIFKGNREPFKGLWIDSPDHDFKMRESIPLSMSHGHSNATGSRLSLIHRLDWRATRDDLEKNPPNADGETTVEVVTRELVRSLPDPDKIDPDKNEPDKNDPDENPVPVFAAPGFHAEKPRGADPNRASAKPPGANGKANSRQTRPPFPPRKTSPSFRGRCPRSGPAGSGEMPRKTDRHS